ncbi:MAG: DEAD/DEAH box helicase, partial [Bacillus sp. (in: firmicutes)]
MEQILQNNIGIIKQRFRLVLQAEAVKYIEMQGEQATFETFIAENDSRLEQLLEVELKGNILNGISMAKRKELLKAEGVEIADLRTKIINTLVREQLLKTVDLDCRQWLDHFFKSNPNKWTEWKEQAISNQQQKLILADLEEKVTAIFASNNIRFYLPLRHQTAQRLAADLSNVQYDLDEDDELIETGSFDADAYLKLEDFLSEYTGGEIYYGHEIAIEIYEDRYEAFITEYVYHDVLAMIIELLPDEMQKTEDLSEKISELLSDELADLLEDFLYRITDELVVDLLELSSTAFQEDVHREMYVRQLADRKKKINEHKRKAYLRFEQEKAEQRERAKREEEMILQMIGREYEANLSPHTKYILHIGETNTGKTHTALTEMRQAATGLYLGPLRLLALEVYETLTGHGVRCGLKTGEEEKNLQGATHISATVEMFSSDERYECVVIDEAQMIADRDRGFSWYKAITSVQADTVHIIGSNNVGSMLIHLLDGYDVEVRKYKRELPLIVQKKNFRISKVTKGDALIVFSRKKVLQVAAKLENDGHKVSIIYGGMPPETRQKQIEQFHKGETEVVVATDAIGMGLNLPIRRVVFLENQKFDGTRVRTLTSQEIKQIAGRAGRKGKYDEGFVAFSYDVQKMKSLLERNDFEIETFAISPTQNIFNRFRYFGKDLQEFFRLWNKYENPPGTVKAPLTEEKELYEEIQGTDIEARLSVADLYSFLHLPFSSYESSLREQWKDNMRAIIYNEELQEPVIHKGSLDALELSYKAIGLHLLFLYKLERRTEAYIWERMRDEISEEVHGLLKKEIKKYKKECKYCGRELKWDYQFTMCQSCHNKRYGRNYW